MGREQMRVIVSGLALCWMLAMPGAVSAQGPSLIGSWGAFGTNPGQFQNVGAIALDPSGDVYAADASNRTIQKFSPSGTFRLRVGPNLPQSTFYMNQPWDVAVDAEGNLFIADRNWSKVFKTDKFGRYLRDWGDYGGGPGQFSFLIAITIDQSGILYTVEQEKARIQKFTRDGVYLGQILSPPSGSGRFSGARDVAVDESGRVFVLASGGKVQVFEPDGTFIRTIGGNGASPGQLTDASAVALDRNGRVYLADPYRGLVIQFASDGRFLNQWSPGGAPGGYLWAPQALAVDPSFNVYVGGGGGYDPIRSSPATVGIQKFGPVPTPTVAVSWGRVKNLYR